MTGRSSLAEVRNPVLKLKMVKRLLALPRDQQEIIRGIYLEAQADANERAEKLWRKSKPPMAAYWKARATEYGHMAKAIGSRPKPVAVDQTDDGLAREAKAA